MKYLESFRRQLAAGSEIHALFDCILQHNGGGESRSQEKQDVFALIVNQFKRDGFFVEFGATNGIEISNTYLLEQHYGWRGIVAEPEPSWHDQIKSNRNCIIETDCVWRKTGETLHFDVIDKSGFSTISSFSGNDQWARKRRRHKRTIDVRTIALKDMLDRHGAPQTIDYLSVDTEGSEYEILAAFDFSAYRFNLITVEHNYTPSRARLNGLLQSHGYRRVFDHLSKCDDWYVPA